MSGQSHLERREQISGNELCATTRTRVLLGARHQLRADNPPHLSEGVTFDAILFDIAFVAAWLRKV